MERLIELGYEAEFVTGRWREPWDKPSRHAWVVFKQEDRLFLLEAVNKHGRSIVRPLEEVRAEYLPEVSVDHKLQRYAYNGYLHYLRIVVNKPAPKPARAAYQIVADDAGLATFSAFGQLWWYSVCPSSIMSPARLNSGSLGGSSSSFVARP